MKPTFLVRSRARDPPVMDAAASVEVYDVPKNASNPRGFIREGS